jgi:hypothetical protein
MDKIKTLVPTQYHDYIDWWDYKEAQKLQPHRPGVDHEILLQPDAKPQAKAYVGNNTQQTEVVKAYVDKMYSKGFVRPSKSAWAAPVIVVKKPAQILVVCKGSIHKDIEFCCAKVNWHIC